MKHKFKFTIYKSKGRTFWRCVRGGNIVCDGSEDYSKPAGARRAVKALTDAMLPGTFTIVDETKRKA